MPYEITAARVRLALPDWQVRSEDESRCIRRMTTTGDRSIDERAARAQETVERSGRVSELVLVRDRQRGVTPVVHLWVSPSDTQRPVLELAREGVRTIEGAPGFVMLEPARTLALPGISDAAVSRYRSSAAIRGGELRDAESVHVQLRHAGHLVMLKMTTPVDVTGRPDALFARVLQSIAAL
ncbi:hypothetical protein DB32_006965 [Sandaracinus amylolyticus]|uniref:Uncharacterized protein n=1 Tax=Sandaracinus amylolyticus TaxID=927083 RepID=A0A0F6YMZ3_9BACT|nr:hypothetical protein DB32_006965 [Sandaracinus amylolyticus]